MGWSRGENGKVSRCPENGREEVAMKAEIAMGDCLKKNGEQVQQTR